MTMQFRTVKADLVARLEDNATTYGYRVAGYNDNSIDAAELVGDYRLVQIYAKGGQIPKNTSAVNGPVEHVLNLQVDLLAAAVCSVDLSILESETATDADRASALSASTRAAANADDSADELFEAVFQVLMDNRYRDLEMPGEVADLWVSDWNKGSAIDRGNHVVIPISVTLSIRMMEDLDGSTPKTPVSGEAVTVAINASADTDGTPQEGTAVTAGG
jgi:hypothetical protein